MRVRVPVSNEMHAAVTRAADDMGISPGEFAITATAEKLDFIRRRRRMIAGETSADLLAVLRNRCAPAFTPESIEISLLMLSRRELNAVVGFVIALKPGAAAPAPALDMSALTAARRAQEQAGHDAAALIWLLMESYERHLTENTTEELADPILSGCRSFARDVRARLETGREQMAAALRAMKGAQWKPRRTMRRWNVRRWGAWRRRRSSWRARRTARRRLSWKPKHS